MTALPLTLDAPPAGFEEDDDDSEIELLDPETWEVPRRLSEEDRFTYVGGQGRRRPRAQTGQDDEP